MRNALQKAARRGSNVVTPSSTPGTGVASEARRAGTGPAAPAQTPFGMPPARTSSFGNPSRTALPGLQRRDLHSIAAGTLQRFNDPAAYRELAERNEHVLISTFDSEDDVRRHNPRFEAAAAAGRRIFEERGLRLRFAFGVDSSRRPEQSRAVADMLDAARREGIDMTVVDMRFPRSNEETPTADAAYLQATAHAQYDMNVRRMEVTHTNDSRQAENAPDGEAIAESFHPYFAPGSSRQMTYTQPLESSPHGPDGGPVRMRLDGRTTVGRTDFDSTHPDEDD